MERRLHNVSRANAPHARSPTRCRRYDRRRRPRSARRLRRAAPRRGRAQAQRGGAVLAAPRTAAPSARLGWRACAVAQRPAAAARCVAPPRGDDQRPAGLINSPTVSGPSCARAPAERATIDPASPARPPARAQLAEVVEELPLPSSPQQQVAQAAAALVRARQRGVNLAVLELQLPLIGRTDLDDWPCAPAPQQRRVAAPQQHRRAAPPARRCPSVLAVAAGAGAASASNSRRQSRSWSSC